MNGYMRFRLFILVLAASVLSLSCGGNGGGGAPSGTQPPATTVVRFSSLSGAQEVPSVTTAATGSGVLAVNTTTGAISGFIVTSGLVNATAAHIHDNVVGSNGPVIVPLAGGPDIWTVPDGATLTADQITKFNAGGLYFNAHTAANPGGEIRGQIDRDGTVMFASLSGAQEVPSVTTAATGSGILAAEASTGDISGFIVTSGLVNATAAHIHDNVVGSNGPVIVPLAGGPDIWTVPDGARLTADQITKFGSGGLYFNAHTAANPGGEIRGQIDLP